jgi:tripartite-type tricarboxylate transporter receptor subunit TctC
MTKAIFKKILLVAILLALVSTPVSSASAAEKKFPTRYVDLYYGFPGGSATEIQNRLLSEALGKYLGVTVVSVSKPGGGGVVAGNLLVNSPPDGYTLANLSFNSICQTILLSKGALTLDDVRVVGQWNRFGGCIFTSVDSPWKTVQELIDYARKNPGLKYAGQGVGNSTALRMDNLVNRAKLQMIAVPFKGTGEVVAAILGKHLQVGIGDVVSARAQAEAGKMRILMSFDPAPMFGLDPSIPHLAAVFEKSVVDKDIPIVGFVIAPRKTPDDVINILEKALAKACTDPELINGMVKGGGAVDFFDAKTGTENLRRILELVKELQR